MTTPHDDREFANVPIGLIREPALPSRAAMDETALDELTADIRSRGVIQPIILARVDDEFEVVAGHRRTLASKRAGRATIPAIVYPTMTSAMEGIKYAENRFREDLNPADEAIWFSELLERDAGGDTEKLAAQLGEKRDYVENRLLLFQGDADVFAELQNGKIKVGVAQALNGLRDDQYRKYLLRAAISQGATVSIVKRWISEYQNAQVPTSTAAAPESAPAPMGPVAQVNWFVCACCDRTDNIQAMQPINVHTWCRQAILEPALASFSARGQVIAYPKTADDAVEIINDLIEKFSLSGESPAK